MLDKWFLKDVEEGKKIVGNLCLSILTVRCGFLIELFNKKNNAWKLLEVQTELYELKIKYEIEENHRREVC